MEKCNAQFPLTRTPQIQVQLERHAINVYDFPDSELTASQKSLPALMPFGGSSSRDWGEKIVMCYLQR